MNLHDITHELFASPIYPDDPIPHKELLLNMEKGDSCNLSILTIGSHNGTHMDAPRHFNSNGNDICQIPLSKCMGECKIISAFTQMDKKVLTRNDVKKILSDGTKKLLIKGNVEISEEAAREMAEHGLELLGVEGLSVGAEEATASVHTILLKADVVILESLNLKDILPGNYLLAAQPLKMEGLDGSPVRAVLIEQTDAIPGYDQVGMHRIRLKDIYYFESVDEKVFIYCKDKVFECRKKLYELETVGGGFFRASKSTVVNINMLETTRPSLSGRFRASLSNGEEIEISRQYVPVLKRMLGV